MTSSTADTQPPCVATSDSSCRQNTVVIIYVFSTFGLVLLVLLGLFYICHRYGQRLDREAQRNQQLARQDIENKLVPIKQACFIEQPDGQSDIAWAITTTVEAEPPGAAVKPGKAARAAHTRLIAESSAMQTAGSSELLLMPSTSCSGGSSAPLAM